MRMRIVGLAALGAIVSGGCAGMRYAQEFTRLRADIGLLDQRLSQLERSAAQSSVMTWPMEAHPEPAQQPIRPAAATPASAPLPNPLPLASRPSNRDIQQALKNAGFYHGPIDGKIGQLTREATRTFQHVNGLKVDGVVGPKTWEKLSPYRELDGASGAGNASLSAAEPLK